MLTAETRQGLKQMGWSGKDVRMPFNANASAAGMLAVALRAVALRAEGLRCRAQVLVRLRLVAEVGMA